MPIIRGGAIVVPQRDRHPYKLPSAYLFTHFTGANPGEFNFGTSGGNGASAGMITGSTEGYSRIVSGTVANARGFINSGLQSMRLGQSANGQMDLFRARGYLNAVQSAANRSIVQIGFLNNNGAPTCGAFFQYDANISLTWQMVTMDGSQAASTLFYSGVEIVPNANYDLRIEVVPNGEEARFYIDDNLIVALTTNIPKTSGREVGVVAVINRVSGTFTHSLSLDHLGGGVRQTL